MRAGIRQATLTGVVLHLRDIGESNRVVEVLSVEEGRVSLLGRGARNSRKRFQGALDLFVSLRLRCTVRPGLWSLEAADVLVPRLGIRRDLARLKRASLLTEIARVLAPEHEEAVALHSALCQGLDALDRGEVSQAALSYPKLLIGAGIASGCARCGRCDRRAPEGLALEPRDGALLCEHCAGSLPRVPATIWEGRAEAALTEVIAATVETQVAAWVETHLGHALKSARAWLSWARR
jgi:DNA repair protein RecO (recombination protein O)